MNRRLSLSIRRVAALLAWSAIGVASADLLRAQQVSPAERIDRAVRAAAKPLDFADDGALSGGGADWLLDRARAAEFVLLGESHGNVETPRLNLWLLDELEDAGFSAYATENGPIATAIAIDRAKAGSVDGLRSLLRQVPFSIAFLNYRADAETFAGALDLGYAVWGLDQEFIGSGRLLLQRLASLAPNDDAKQLAEEWLERAVVGFTKFAQTGDQSTGFLVVVTDDDFDAFDAAFADGPAEAKTILAELRATATIYRHYREGRGYLNNYDRIQLMKRHLHEQLRAAGGAPKVVFRFGSMHMGRGYSPLDQLDLGNAAAELAAARGGDSFHVYVVARWSANGEAGQPREFAPNAVGLAPFKAVVDDEGACVFDLTALRPLLLSRRMRTEAPELHELARRFDAALVLDTFHASEQFVPMRRR